MTGEEDDWQALYADVFEGIVSVGKFLMLPYKVGYTVVKGRFKNGALKINLEKIRELAVGQPRGNRGPRNTCLHECARSTSVKMKGSTKAGSGEK